MRSFIFNNLYYSYFSVSKTTRELVLKWSAQPVKLSPEVKMPQFKVQDVIAEECDEAAVLGEKLIGFCNIMGYEMSMKI